MNYFLYRKYSERTLKKKLSDNVCKSSFKHLYKTLYYRFSKYNYLKEINVAINKTSELKKNYIRK